MLSQGGNAFDAAIAVASTLAVVEPFSSGLGGGGFFLLHRNADGFEVMVDAREIAPGNARPDMYLGSDGQPDTKSSLEGAKAAAIPGLPAALPWLARKYGRLPLATVLAPAIAFARDGFATDARFTSVIASRQEMLRASPQLAEVFLDHNAAPVTGFVVRQPNLARTLEAIGKQGEAGFYRGDVARRLVSAVQAAGGIWAVEDLQRYKIVERKPERFTYRGATITCAALPSAGGLALAQSLQIIERYPLAQLSRVDRTHLIAEALRRAFQDRTRYLGDPDFVQIPNWLDTRAYADKRAASIDLAKATPSETLDTLAREGDNTTHFSVIDREGNRVGATLTINLPFGAGVMAGDTGVILNDEMNDFAIAPGTPNVFRLVGEAGNRIEAFKRPLSSMTPTFVEDDRGVLVLGTPGGSRIISMVLLGVVDYLDGGAIDLDRLVSAPRYHHQYLPDRIEYEPGGFPPELIEGLRAKGHVVQEGRRKWGNMQAVFLDRVTGEANASSDPRGIGGTGALF